MGYEANSPVKQVWLPLDYDWINNHLSGDSTFGSFAKAYKEKYGIDLHDIFKLVRVNEGYAIGVKADLVGSYNVGLLDGLIDTKYGLTNALKNINSYAQGVDTHILISVAVGDSVSIAYGFSLVLPIQGTSVNSIDDLRVALFEL